MTYKNFYIATSLFTFCTLIGDLSAHAASLTHSGSFNIRQTANNTFSSNLFGQSFIPNQRGSGSVLPGEIVPPTSGNASLNSFQFALNAREGLSNDVGSKTLYIYNSLPTFAQLSNGTNALYTSTNSTDGLFFTGVIAGRTWVFNNAVLDVNTTYFALLQSGSPLRLNTENAYSSGELVQDFQISQGFLRGDTNFDAAFTANFSAAATPVPFEFSPVFGLEVLGGLFVAKKLSKKFLKKNLA